MGFFVERDISPAERMSEIGIVQDGDPILREVCKPFVFPQEADEAAWLGDMLIAHLEKAREIYDFSAGCGLSLPQLGYARSGAAVRVGGEETLVLYNPCVTERSEDAGEAYEGCLSLFNYRGIVARPQEITVEYDDPKNGQLQSIDFYGFAARMWAHEIDHLNGILYTDRMTNGEEIKLSDSYKLYAQNRVRQLEVSR